MTDLAQFLLERFAEERARVYRCDSDGEFRVTWLTLRRDDGTLDYTTVASDHRNGYWCANGTSYHEEAGQVEAAEPFYDAALVLADLEAKRAIIEELGPPYFITGGSGAAYEAVLRLLAVPYADHPDYREEWRP